MYPGGNLMKWEVKLAIFITIAALVVVLAYVIISPYSENGQFSLRRGNFFNFAQGDTLPPASIPSPIATLNGSTVDPTYYSQDSVNDQMIKKPLTPLPLGDKTGLAPVNRLVIDPEIKNVTFLYPILAIKDSDKPNILKTIDMSSDSEVNKSLIKESLKQLWIEYPVVFEDVNEETTLVRFDKANFSNNAARNPVILSEVDNKTLVNIAKIFADGMSNEDRTEKNKTLINR
jgi:hypothetical protein